MLRRWRSRAGLQPGPRAVVRAHVPWYWWTLATVAVLVAFLAVAGWAYNAGRRNAGFDQAKSEQRIVALRDSTTKLEGELSRLRNVANLSEGNLQIERTTEQQLVGQVKALQEENGHLKEDLAFFANLAAGEVKGPSGPVINRLEISKDPAPGQYRYRMLVAMLGPHANSQEFKGNLQLIVSVQRQGKDAKIVLPTQGDPDRQRFAVNFKRFERIEGTFSVPDGAKVVSVEAKLLENGATRATQSASTIGG